MGYWTTEQVAEHLGIDPQDVYESRRRGAFPGNKGVRRGRRLMFPAGEITSPSEPETTTDPGEAILWALAGIHETCRAIHNELRKGRNVTMDEVLDMFGYTREELEETSP